MITVENVKTYSDEHCYSCNSHNDTVKDIIIKTEIITTRGSEWKGLYFSLCNKCRKEMINQLLIAEQDCEAYKAESE